MIYCFFKFIFLAELLEAMSLVCHHGITSAFSYENLLLVFQAKRACFFLLLLLFFLGTPALLPYFD